MADGYRTFDQIDLNDIYYGDAGIRAAADMYQPVVLPIIPALAMPSGEKITKYAISERNGFQAIGFGEVPNRKQVTMAAMYPVVAKYGYAVSTDRDTLLRSTGVEIMLDLERPMKEDPEHVFTRMVDKITTDPGAANAGYGLYNGQFAVEENLTAPPRFQQHTFTAGHTHYLCSDTPGQFKLLDVTAGKAHIRHHGNSGKLVGFLNSTMRQQLEDQASWQGTTVQVANPLTDAVAIEGFQDIFRVAGVEFYVTEVMQDDYVVIAEAGQSPFGRLMVMYEPDNIKGLQYHPGPSGEYPIIDSSWDRWFGLKILNRGAAVVIDCRTGHNDVYMSPTYSYSNTD